MHSKSSTVMAAYSNTKAMQMNTLATTVHILSMSWET